MINYKIYHDKVTDACEPHYVGAWNWTQLLWSKWINPPDRRIGKVEQAKTPGNLRKENGRIGASSCQALLVLEHVTMTSH